MVTAAASRLPPSTRQRLRAASVALKARLNALHPFGHVLVRDSAAPSWERFLDDLRRRGRTPRTVVDIGVAWGTPTLYRALPDAHYVLVDPTQESLPYLRSWAEKLDAEVHNVALGDREGVLEISIPAKDIGAASLLEDEAQGEVAARYEVSVHRFDQLIGPLEKPALCKIDVQGAELDVLRGMGDRVGDFAAFIIEVSVLATVRDGPELIDVASFMYERGYVVWDVLALGRRPLDGALAQMDLVFVPRDDPWRRDRRWQAS